MNEEVFDTILIIIRKFIEKDNFKSAAEEVERNLYCARKLSETLFDNGHAEEQKLKLSSLLQIISSEDKSKQEKLEYIKNMIF